MDDGSLFSILMILLLVFLASRFASMETAFSCAPRARLRAAQERGDARADRALRVLDRFDSAVTTLLICTNIVHLTAAAMVTVLVTRLWGMGAVVWGTIGTTLVLFFAGEMLPKSMARKRSGAICLQTASLMLVLMKVFSPLAAALTGFGHAVSSLTRGDAPVTVTEEELHDIIEDMTDAGDLDAQQGDLVRSALEFGDVTAENILTARVDMAAVDSAWDSERITAFVRSCRHSRLPVYEGSIDNIIGILPLRRFMRWRVHGETPLDLPSLLDEPYFIPAGIALPELLQQMNRRRVNLAVVTDAWGGTLGIVTVEDILEELVGEIWDEEDVVVDYCVPLGGGRYELDAGLSVGEAFEHLGFSDPEDDDELARIPLAEWAQDHFDRLPVTRDRFVYHGLEFTVSEVRRQRIIKLTARLLPAEGGETV